MSFTPIQSEYVAGLSPGLTIRIPNKLPDIPQHSAVSYVGWGLVPQADLRIMALYGSNLIEPVVVLDVFNTIGISSTRLAIFISIGLFVLLAIAAIYLMLKTRIIFSGDGDLSLSRVHLLFWFILIVSTSAYVGALSGELANLSPEPFILLGMIVGIVCGAALAYEAIAQMIIPPFYGARRSPQWEDFVSTAVQIKVEKVQLLVFTSLIGLLWLIEVARTGSFPSFSSGEIVLLGMSNALFLATKALEVTTDRVREGVQTAILGPGMTRYRGFANFDVVSNERGVKGTLTLDTEQISGWEPVWVSEGERLSIVIFKILVHSDDPSMPDIERDIPVPAQGRKVFTLDFPPIQSGDGHFWVTILQSNRTVQVLESHLAAKGREV
jgi:hypothetical protein